MVHIGHSSNKESSEREVFYQLPDGSQITIGCERFLAPETYFNPACIGSEMPPLHEATYRSLQMCETDIQQELYQNIVLFGGSSLFPGLQERLHNELTGLFSGTIPIKISVPPGREYAAWRGGTMLSAQNIFSKFWVWKDDYLDYGTVVARPGVLSKFSIHPLGQGLDLSFVRARQEESCPFCGTLGIFVGSEKKNVIKHIFCLTCKNKI